MLLAKSCGKFSSTISKKKFILNFVRTFRSPGLINTFYSANLPTSVPSLYIFMNKKHKTLIFKKARRCQTCCIRTQHSDRTVSNYTCLVEVRSSAGIQIHSQIEKRDKLYRRFDNDIKGT
jgi:hypothetical protein